MAEAHRAELGLLADAVRHLLAALEREPNDADALFYLGIILGGFSGFVADSPVLGWRFAFTVTGVLGVVYSIPLLFLLKDTPQSGREGAETGKPTPWQSIRTFVTNPSFLLLAVYFTLVAMPGWMMKDWMPSMLKDQFNISQGRAGVSAGLYVNVAGFAGLFLGGLTSDRWVRRNARGRTFVSAIGMAALIPALYGLGHSPTLGVAILFLSLFGLGFGLYDCNNMPILAQLVRPEMRATGYGIMNLVSISCGGVADWGFGILRDRHVPLFGIFGIFASAAIVSIVLVLLIRPRYFDPPVATAAAH